MGSSRFAEWILCRFMASTRAASLVGDLEELKAQKGRFWFWRSLAILLVTLCWRRFAATIVASYLGTRIYKGFLFVITGPMLHHRPQAPWQIALLLFYAIDALLWTVFIFSAIRNGVRDTMTQQAFLWAGLIAAAMVSWAHTSIFLFLVGLGIALICSSLARQQSRRWIAALVATVSVGFAILFLDVAVLQIIGYRGSQEHSWSAWVFAVLPFASGWLVTVLFSQMCQRVRSVEVDIA